ncbi:MAG TPA: hypothetical protein VK686_21765 [Bryobacteraceae bacterium]|nr:hypothetical protein [Bryobacteraceae bacterium]
MRPGPIRVFFLLAMVSSARLFAQDGGKDEIIQKLIERVDALEREVAALQPAQTPTKAVTAAPSAIPSQPGDTSISATTDTASAPGDNASRFTFHGYADVGFLRNYDGASDDKRFALGELDLFATEQLSPRLTALVEIVLETDNQTQVSQVPVNLERMLLQYRGNNYFNLDMGSYRTAVGFYNMAYLRGSWLQTALSRPLLFTFEDDGGFLPLHNVGVSANGAVPSGALGLHYIAEIGSSRNIGQNTVSPIDPADNRAVNLALFARPRGLPGFQAGFSSYHDRFSKIFGNYLDRSVWTAYAVYQGHGVEFLNEGALATFRNSASSYGRIPAGYSQIGYRIFPSWTPYIRYEYANANGRNVQNLPRLLTPWRQVWLGGLRYDITEFAALKFELGHETSWLQPAWIRAAVQLAFTF